MILPNKSTSETAGILGIAIGLIIIIAGGWNYTTVLLGAAISIGSIIEVKSFRLGFKIIVNKASGKQVFQVNQRDIRNSNIIGNVLGDLHIHNMPGTVAPAKKVTKSPELSKANANMMMPEGRPEVLLDVIKSIGPYGYADYAYRLNQGDKISGRISSDGSLNVFLFDSKNHNKFLRAEEGSEEDEDFDYFGDEDITRCTLNEIIDRSGNWFLVLQNLSEDDPVEVKIDLVRFPAS